MTIRLLTHSRRRAIALLFAVLVGITMVVGATLPKAEAQRGNMVILGDSITADPHSVEYLGGRLGIHPNGSSDVSRWCPTSDSNFGKLAARQMGLEPHDYSCAGAVSIGSGPNVATQIDRAIRERGLNRDTRRVIVQIGFNDTYQRLGQDFMGIRRDFVNYMRPQIDKIRRAAPQARIQLVGYPTITDNGHVCLFHVGPNVYDRTPFGLISDLENLAQWMNVDLARATRTEFLDLKPVTRGNGMCSNDENRMFAGLVDFHAGFGHMPIHINQRGHAHIANVVARS